MGIVVRVGPLGFQVLTWARKATSPCDSGCEKLKPLQLHTPKKLSSCIATLDQGTPKYSKYLFLKSFFVATVFWGPQPSSDSERGSGGFKVDMADQKVD